MTQFKLDIRGAPEGRRLHLSCFACCMQLIGSPSTKPNNDLWCVVRIAV